MKVVEVNRMIEIWEKDNRVSDKIAEGLEYVIGTGVECCQDEDSVRFEENMKKYFPNPFDRTRVLKKLVISACMEEPDEDDECVDPGEAEYFMKVMLKTIIEAADTSDSIENFRGSMAGILA